MALNAYELDQQDHRTVRSFRDQHGRKWQGVIERRTMAPCGALALVMEAPVVVRPPLMPPQKYVRVTDITSGEVNIRYNEWLEDLDRGVEEYERFIWEQASDLYKDAAASEIDKMPPALRRRIGRSKPMARELVLAMRAGNPWILGLTTERPKWVERFIEKPPEADELAFMREDGDLSFMEEAEAPPKKKRKPYVRGQGLKERNALLKRAKDMGLDVEMNATKAELEEVIANAAEPEPVGAGGVDPSWYGGR